MTIESTLHCLKVMVEEENCENCPCYGETGTDHCEKDAVRVAIASLEALEEIRQEAVDAIEDGLYVRNTRILDIIDKHIKDGDSK